MVFNVRHGDGHDPSGRVLALAVFLAVSCCEFADAHAHSSQDERKIHNGCERESSSREYGVARCGSVGKLSHAHTPISHQPLVRAITARTLALAHVKQDDRTATGFPPLCPLLCSCPAFPPTCCREDTLRHFGQHREGALHLQTSCNRIW